MRSINQVRQVGQLVAAGLNDCEIERRTQVPRRTAMEWRHTRRWERWPYNGTGQSCARCSALAHNLEALPAEYVYLLGMYLGDGHIVLWRKGVYRLIVAMDGAYPQIIEECSHAVAATVPGAPPFRQPQKGSRCVRLVKYSKAWQCLFPQHGPGRKHKRSIALSGWQQELVERHPELFLRGLIHSDGCRFMNRVRHGDKLYAYVRYCFSNASADIRKLFATRAICSTSSGGS